VRSWQFMVKLANTNLGCKRGLRFKWKLWARQQTETVLDNP
jgi:hypothetical protein